MVEAPPSAGEVVDYAALAKDLAASSPLETLDTALDLFGKNIAIAFRWAPHACTLVSHVCSAPACGCLPLIPIWVLARQVAAACSSCDWSESEPVLECCLCGSLFADPSPLTANRGFWLQWG